MKKSWFGGAATVLIVHILWIVLILTQAHADRVMGAIIVMLFVTMNIAGLGAFVSALLAPRRRFLLGLSMAPLVARPAAREGFRTCRDGPAERAAIARGHAGRRTAHIH